MPESDAVAQKVEFWDQDSPDKLMALCLVVRKHYDRGETVVVLAADKGQLDQLMERLWTFSQRDFIPHETVSSTQGIEIDRVLVTADETQLPNADVLVLARPCPMERFEGYGTIVDFAETYDETLRAESRQRFKAYKDAGYHMVFVKSDKS